MVSVKVFKPRQPILGNSNKRQIRGATSLIGNTPLPAIEFMFRNQKRILYPKAENLNMTGRITPETILCVI
jgi:hypothetical protein